MSLDQSLNKILIIDFGSQFTQLIARRIRELGVFSEIVSHKKIKNKDIITSIKGIILSGGPLNVYEIDKYSFDPRIIEKGTPILGICFGHQILSKLNEGKIKKDYELNASIKNGLIKVINKKYISDINLNLNVKNNDYSLNNLILNFDNLKFFSQLIKIKKVNKDFLINGDIKNNNSNIKPEVLNLIFKDNMNNIENLNFKSENEFSFQLNKKFCLD